MAALGAKNGSAGEPPSLQLYRRQLEEIDAEIAFGRLAEGEAAATRAEIGRRLLRESRRPVQVSEVTRSGHLGVLAAALLVPVLATLLYTALGSPELPDQPLASRTAPAEEEGTADIRQMVSGLQTRLEQRPDDLEGWLMLGRSRLVLGQALEAIAALRRAQSLAPDDPRVLVALGEALTVAGGGNVSPEARTLLARADEAEGDDPRPAFYLGLADAQAGNRDGAAARWRKLLLDAPEGAPWRGEVVDAIREASANLGMDQKALFAGIGQGERGGATPNNDRSTESRDIARMAPADQAEAIRGMVAGLDARLQQSGGSASDWARLGQARMVLGERDKAQAAYDKALQLAPNDPRLLASYGEALLGERNPDTRLPTVTDQALSLFERAATLDPAAPAPQWYLGIRALQEGRIADARAAWSRALAALDPTDPGYANVKSLLDAMQPANEPAGSAGG